MSPPAWPSPESPAGRSGFRTGQSWRPLRVSLVSFPQSPPDLPPPRPGSFRASLLLGRLTPRSLAFYSIPRRRGRVSPPASFRPRLATGVLALGYAVRCCLRPLETLTPDTGHAGHTNKKGPAFRPGPPHSARAECSPDTGRSYGFSVLMSTFVDWLSPTFSSFTPIATIIGVPVPPVSDLVAMLINSPESVTEYDHMR